MEAFFQKFVIGIQTGAIYALIAVGYTMVYGVLKMINFAHGEVYMLGAFFAFFAFTQWFHFTGPPSYAALAGVLLLCGLLCAMVGFVIERFAYRPLRNSPRLTALITAIGVSFLLQNVALLAFGADPKFIPSVLPQGSLRLGPVVISIGQLALLVVSLGLMTGLRFLVMRTAFGRSMRAVSQDFQAAALMGINVDRVIALTFMLGAFLAGVGGAMTASFTGIKVVPFFGVLPGVKAFVAAVLGGIGNIPGALFGGLIMGVAEAFVGASRYSTYRDGIAFLILILVLLIRPAGLLGKAAAEKV